jgi:Uma2 family endonuclease
MTTIDAPRIRRRYTPEDLLAMPDSVRFELVNGQLVERNMGWESSLVGGRLLTRLSTHCDSHKLGYVLPADASYQCFPDAPTKVRKPDVSFVRIDRMAAADIPAGHCRIAPDLAVEVVSPNDFYDDVVDKSDEYLRAGVRAVWIVSPMSRSVVIRGADGSVRWLGVGDELSTDSVIPGFSCAVAELFLGLPIRTEAAES